MICRNDGECEICDAPEPRCADCKEILEDCPCGSICLGCDRHEDDDDYGRDPDCGECFRDPTPLTQESVTAGAAPVSDTRDEHDRNL